MAIGKKTGGRKQGTPNGERKDLLAKINALFPDYHPVIALAEIANDKKLEINIRLQANKECAKYVAQQLKAIEHSGNIEGKILSIFKLPDGTEIQV
jgi:hypothetical protein